jgi:hypothetical protein
MGCHTSRAEGVITVDAHLERTSIQRFDDVFSSAEEVIATINRISGNLSVVLDTFKTIADLHSPPRPLGVGIFAVFVALSAFSDANFSRINLYLTDTFPGFDLSTAALDDEQGRTYSVWKRMTEELDTSLGELEGLVETWLESVVKVKSLRAELNQLYSGGEARLVDARKLELVLTTNNNKLQQASELFRELVLLVQGAVSEIIGTVSKVNSPNTMRELHRLGLAAAERSLTSLPDILREFGRDLEHLLG